VLIERVSFSYASSLQSARLQRLNQEETITGDVVCDGNGDDDDDSGWVVCFRFET
jgi:hypothetical protein